MTRSIAALAFLLSACAPGDGAPDVAISDAWVRESRDTSTAAYARIANGGRDSDRLIEVGIPGGGRASLHESRLSNGIARMAPLPQGLEVPAGAVVELRPGGAHVMLSGLPKPPRTGERLTLTLRFERSGERRVEFEVRPALVQR